MPSLWFQATVLGIGLALPVAEGEYIYTVFFVLHRIYMRL